MKCAKCGFSSGSSLFGNVPVCRYQERNGLRQNYSKRVLSETSTKDMRDIKSSGNISIIHRHTHQPVAGRFLIIVIPKIMKAWLT